jgi:hypothetical protein
MRQPAPAPGPWTEVEPALRAQVMACGGEYLKAYETFLRESEDEKAGVTALAGLADASAVYAASRAHECKYVMAGSTYVVCRSLDRLPQARHGAATRKPFAT